MGNPFDKVILWDFDGTLSWRHGLWRSALMQALDEELAGHGVREDDISPYLQKGFPWHEPERPHPELNEPEAWWRHIEGLLARAFLAVGVPKVDGARLAHRARFAFIDPSSYRLFDDTHPALEALAARGWRHLILSNHVPELADIVAGLGIADLFDEVISSALIGYEKPHPRAYGIALEAAGHPGRVWMVGDNAAADVRGAEAVGIPGILVRREGDVRRKADDLWSAIPIIESA
jgi:putative hydrolase of the HAD superfamily